MPIGTQKEASMVKLIIFDFDGVIITGSHEGYFTCYHRALEAVGVQLDPAEEKKRIIENWGKGYKLQLEYLLRDHPKLLSNAITAYEKCYYSPLFSKNVRLIKGVKNTLRALAKEHTLAIASGMMKKRLYELLQKLNIRDIFQALVAGDEIQNPEDKKPAPVMLNKLLERFSISKEQAVYVGDTANDVVMARNAGIEPIVALTGHLTREEAIKLGVQTIIPDITHLPDIL